jgi:hypothetical protein
MALLGKNAGGLHDNYGSALTEQPSGSQGRPATNTSSRLIVRIGLPTDVFPVPLVSHVRSKRCLSNKTP